MKTFRVLILGSLLFGLSHPLFGFDITPAFSLATSYQYGGTTGQKLQIEGIARASTHGVSLAAGGSLPATGGRYAEFIEAGYTVKLPVSLGVSFKSLFTQYPALGFSQSSLIGFLSVSLDRDVTRNIGLESFRFDGGYHARILNGENLSESFLYLGLYCDFSLFNTLNLAVSMANFDDFYAGQSGSFGYIFTLSKTVSRVEYSLSGSLWPAGAIGLTSQSDIFGLSLKAEVAL